MRIPDSLTSLAEHGIIDEVLRPLMSGKEAQIYLVVAAGTECVAKIYKEAQNRTFKHRADYTEGRKVRNSRDQRAINKRSQHGKNQDEAAWRSTEVDMIYKLRAAGVRVPVPHHFIDGVLIMELVTDEHGEPAPRLGELDFTPDEATVIYERLIRDCVRMLCAGVVHGDLSDFNVLLGADGPVIIDFPQAVDPSKNQNAKKLLLRDVENLHRFYTRFVPTGRRVPYGEEMWALYEANQLTPDTVLKGQYRGSQKRANTDALLEFIGEVNEDERRRRTALGLNAGAVPPRPRRVEVIVNTGDARGRRPAFVKGRPGAPAPAVPQAVARPVDPLAAPVPGRRRRRRKPKAPNAVAHTQDNPGAQRGAAPRDAQRPAPHHSPRPDPGAQGSSAAPQRGGTPQRPQRPAPEPPQRAAPNVERRYPAAVQRTVARGPRARLS
jgi:RIO kinase 1